MVLKERERIENEWPIFCQEGGRDFGGSRCLQGSKGVGIVVGGIGLG